MTAHGLPAGPLPAAGDSSARVRLPLLVSAGFLVAQVALTDYGGGAAVGVFWLAVGLVLLWLVWRHRSRLARGVVVVTSLFGAVAYAVNLGDGTALLVVAFLGQALPLLTHPVRRHVQPRA